MTSIKFLGVKFVQSHIQYTVFPQINARDVYFKIRDFRGAFIRGGRLFEGGVYFKISKIVETGYGRTKIRKHSCPVINVICTATC